MQCPVILALRLPLFSVVSQGLLFPSLAEYPKDKQFSVHAAPGHPRGVGDDSEPAPAGTRVLGHAHCLQHW